MNLQFDQSTMPISVAKGASFKSEDINAFTKATAGDFATLSSLLNDNVFKILNTLPAFYDPENSHLDGKGFYVDSDSTIVKDNGLFYLNDTQNASNSRPLTVYETFILIMQILANIENAQREGVTVGSYANKVAVSSTSSLTYVWPYADRIYQSNLFEISGGNIVPATLTYSLNPTTKILTVSSASPKNIWGYIWHPVYSF